MASKAWKIIPRPLIETVLNNHAQHHRVPQPLIFHGPRGVGKTTIVLERLMGEWNKGPHVTGYVDLAQSIKDHHPDHNTSYPWSSWSNCDPPTLSNCRTQLEQCLESMVQRGVQLGVISSQQVFTTLNKWNGVSTAIRRIIQTNSASRNAVSVKGSTSVLWGRAVFALSARFSAQEIDGFLGLKEEEKKKKKNLSVQETSCFREAFVALKLAKEVISVQQGWRANAIAHLNRTGGFSRSLANSCTDWPSLMLELLSQAAETGHFQPKLIINNIDILRNAILTDDSSVCASQYHDSLIYRIIALGANEKCLPVILMTSDSYYSYRAYIDFGFPDIFISRETFGWTPAEAKMHMVSDYFSNSEETVWSDADSSIKFTTIAEVVGSNPRHLFELYALKQSNYYHQIRIMNDKGSTFEEILDTYLAYLQVAEVNPAMDKALKLIQNFAVDARNGKISKDKLRFGAPWRHPPHTDEPTLCLGWAKLQLMDFVQCLVTAEFGLNYLSDCSLEIFDDPSAVAMLEVGLLYAQRDPPFIRPVSRGIQRCLVRWLVQEKIQMTFQNSLQYHWHRIIRGRYYRHLMQQIG